MGEAQPEGYTTRYYHRGQWRQYQTKHHTKYHAQLRELSEGPAETVAFYQDEPGHDPLGRRIELVGATPGPGAGQG
jgi:hypothetical protein